MRAPEGTICLPRVSEPLVSILIPTTSQDDLLTRCLESLARHLGAGVACEIIVVLNAATDAVKAVTKNATGILIADSPANLGVAGGYNRARSLARGKYLALLHDDTEIEPFWLESLLETAEAHPEAGAIASMVLYPDGKLQGAGWILWREVATSPVWGSAASPDPDQYTQIRPIDYSGTSSLLVRGSTWDAIGGLDERLYPAYCVDMDLCMSIRKQGQIVLFDPRSRLLHHRGSSSNPRFRQFMAERNREVFSAKWKEEMQTYEAYAPDNPSALQRARAHTENVAAELRKKWSPTASSSPSFILDPALQDLMHLQKERELKKAYISRIESQCVDLEVECLKKSRELRGMSTSIDIAKEKLALKKDECAELKKRCAELKARLKEVEQSRWWRWGRRLRKIVGKS